MFTKSKKKKAAPSASQDVTVVNKGTTIEGEVKVSGTIRIYGRVNGTVRSEGKVVVAEDGLLSGDLYADVAEVSGTVEGLIEADRLDLRSTATVEGNVVVKKFTTETGAIFVGDCKMPQNGSLPSGAKDAVPAAPASSEPASSEAASSEADPSEPAASDAAPSEAEGDAAASAEPAEATSSGESGDSAPSVEPVAVPSGASVDGGVKPLPNKPGEQDAADEDAAEEDAAADARPRFW